MSIDTSQTQFVESQDGTKIAYSVVGEGPAVVIVDGAFCSRAFGPAPMLAPALASDFTVYYYDRRGRGESTDTQPYAVQREVEDLAAVVAATGESPLVFGSSSGGGLALHAVGALSFAKLALWEAPYTVDPEQPAVYATYLRNLHAALAEGRRGDAVDLFMTLVGNPPEMIEGMHQAPFWPAMEGLAPTLAYDGAVLGDQNVPTELAATVQVPTLVLDGGASPESMRNGVKALADAIPGSRYQTLPGQHHDVAVEVLAPALKEFFLQ